MTSLSKVIEQRKALIEERIGHKSWHTPLMSHDETVVFVRDYLQALGLYKYMHTQIGNILLENRRSEWLTTKNGLVRRRGNRDKYGNLPYVRTSGRVRYSETDIINWMYDRLIPELQDAKHRHEILAALEDSH
jgi:hypothetical protein